MTATFVSSRERRQVRALFVSDLHLGAWGSRPRQFLEFLRQTDAGTIYLVGDILDIWHCGKPFWTPTHDAIMDELRGRVRSGTRVVYLPGNHDAVLRKRLGRTFQGMELVDEITHVACDGRRFLVLHGDQCDMRVLRFHIMTRIGSRADAWLRRLDDWARRHLLRAVSQRPERNVVELLIAGVNVLMQLGNHFEDRLVAQAREGGHDGVICGHFHKPALHRNHDIIYANCGDWIDNRTALVETEDGRLELLELRPVCAPQTEVRQPAEVQA